MICGICLENIHLFYYKSKCGCNVYYHNNCIREWYKKQQICIYCKEYDNDGKNVGRIENKFYEMICILLCIFASVVVITTLDENINNYERVIGFIKYNLCVLGVVFLIERIMNKIND
tara:strand:+ start:418 stop:768 length:351 start_codon:yes stop_codon:yes gene_type:complete